MAIWVQEGAAFSLIEGTKRVGCVRPDRETDASAMGWQAYIRGEPKTSNVFGTPIRPLIPGGFFRRLRDAKRHVEVLHVMDT